MISVLIYPLSTDLEYADFIPGRNIKPSQKSVLDMTVNGIWWWGSSSEDLESVEYHFVVIIPSSTLTGNGGTYSGPIDGSNRSLKKLFVLNWNTWYHVTLSYLY